MMPFLLEHVTHSVYQIPVLLCSLFMMNAPEKLIYGYNAVE